MAPIVRVWLVLMSGALLAGCASVRPTNGPSSAHAADRPGEDAVAMTPGVLEEAREAYFQGVRAWVAEELEEARWHFERCRATLEPQVLAGGDDESHRAAEVLTAKADYFLLRIAEIDAEQVGVAEAEAEAAEQAAPVTHASIEPRRNSDVERWMAYFQGDGRDVFQKWLNRQPACNAVFGDIFDRYGLPPEITYHAMIESGYSTGAYSWAHAAGIWQFIRSTGRKYGLRSDWWVDERRDPAKSTEAAARYLADLHAEFGDWELVLAAYNVGEQRIRKQIDRQNTRDFWKLRLPRETRNHVPKFYAAMILGSDPERYGFTSPPPVSLPETEILHVDYSVDFDVLGECCGGVPASTLAELNPALIRRAVPPDEQGYPVVVPAGTRERALAALAELPEDRRVRWAHHSVRRGDTLSEIAEAYRTSVYAIAQANGLRSVDRLRIGQDLLVPQGQRSAGPPPKYLAADPVPSRRKITYVVKKGDTLSQIAERHGTSSRELRRHNRLGSYIYPGQRLTIWTGGGSSSSSSGERVVSVRRGDTLWDIARKHGVTLSSLLRANGLSSRSLIRPGDRIRVPRS